MDYSKTKWHVEIVVNGELAIDTQLNDEKIQRILKAVKKIEAEE